MALTAFSFTFVFIQTQNFSAVFAINWISVMQMLFLTISKGNSAKTLTLVPDWSDCF
jgi:hypothetical protein